MTSNFLGPDIHDSEIVRRYQQMVPALKDKLEKTIRLYANMVRQHADCHDGDVFRLDTSEYSRQLSDVIRHLDEMQLLLNTISSWGSLPAECLYTAMNASEPESRDTLGRQLDFNALEVEGRAQLERMLGVQAVLQKCRPIEKKKEEIEGEGSGVGQFEVKTEGTPAASDTMDTDEGQQQTTTTMTSGDDDEEEEDDDDDEDDEEEDEDEEDEEEERSAAATSQHDSIAGELSPPALLGGRTAIGTPVNPGSVPVQSIQTPPPPPPPRPSTTSGRVSTPQHLHSVHASPVDGLSYRPKEEIRSGPPSFDGGSADLRLEDGSSNSPMTTPNLGPSTLSALMRAGSHSNSPVSLPDTNSAGEVPVTISSLLQPQMPHRHPTILQTAQLSPLVVPKSEPTSQSFPASQQAVKLEVMEQEEGQN